MLTTERLREIDALVLAWEHKEFLKEEYPSHSNPHTTVIHAEDAMPDDLVPAFLKRVADETGIELSELMQYREQMKSVAEQDMVEADEEEFANTPYTEQELRDLP